MTSNLLNNGLFGVQVNLKKRYERSLCIKRNIFYLFWITLWLQFFCQKNAFSSTDQEIKESSFIHPSNSFNWGHWSRKFLLSTRKHVWCEKRSILWLYFEIAKTLGSFCCRNYSSVTSAFWSWIPIVFELFLNERRRARCFYQVKIFQARMLFKVKYKLFAEILKNMCICCNPETFLSNDTGISQNGVVFMFSFELDAN